MQRHSDRKAYLREGERHSLQWSGRIRDGDRDTLSNNNGKEDSRDDPEDGATFTSQERRPSHHHPGTLLSDTSTPTGGASPRPEKEQSTPVLSLSDSSPARDGQGSERKGRLVPVGAHHEGSFGVYMAHKMEKLRDQVDGAVARLEGEVVSSFGFVGGNFARDWLAPPLVMQCLTALLLSQLS